jgi:ribosomal protein S18 acetylase RimI-like enzyme
VIFAPKRPDAVIASNVTAIRLYEKLGFRLRRTPDFLAVRRLG